MNRPSALRNSERGFMTLIGLLVVIVIIGILFALYAGGPVPGTGEGGEGGPSTTLGGAADRGRDAVCRNHLSQIRAAISMHVATTGEFPPSLEAVNAGVPLECPAGDEPYEYDPEAGKVRCVHPGHESY